MEAENKKKGIVKEHRVRKMLRKYFGCSDDQLNVTLMNMLGVEKVPTREVICNNMVKIKGVH